jgi:BRCT domain type II-containing protein
MPELKTTKISKSSGSKIHVGLSDDSPLNINYYVISIEVLGVENGVCFGDTIPGEVISKIVVGKKIGIAFVVKNPLNGSTMVIPGTLEVTN